MQMIADRVGVSKNAVSLALRSDPSISEEMRRKIEQVAAEIGYRRNPAFGELMSQMRRSQSAGTRATIALFNAHNDRNAFRKHSTIPSYVEGCRQRSLELGYQLDEFWLNEPETSGERGVEILEARGIRGVAIVGLMGENRLRECMLPVVDAFPCVVTGVRTRAPALSFASVDHYILTKIAFEKAVGCGYKRPGLVLDRVIDGLVDYRFSAGYRSGQEGLPGRDRLEPFFDVGNGEENRQHFAAWLERERPDVIFTLYNVVRHWLNDLGIKVPKDLGLIQLEWREGDPDWAGMNQHNEITGKVAIDMLIGMIHQGERGVPPFPRATLIGPTWVPGSTIARPRI